MNCMSMRREQAHRMRHYAEQLLKVDKDEALVLFREAAVFDDETDMIEKKYNRKFIKRSLFNV